MGSGSGLRRFSSGLKRGNAGRCGRMRGDSRREKRKRDEERRKKKDEFRRGEGIIYP